MHIFVPKVYELPTQQNSKPKGYCARYRDDVNWGKPDPEIYRLVTRELAVNSTECLIMEDSSAGVKAALAAGMWCIAVTTSFCREKIHAARLPDEQLIDDDPDKVAAVVKRMIEERKYN